MKMIKSLLVGVLCFGLVSAANAATYTSMLFTNSVFTNFFYPSTNNAPVAKLPVQVQQIMIANPSSNTLDFYLYDIPTNSLTVTNAAYTNTVTYLSNYVVMLTNYYGYVTPSITNTVIVDNTNNVVAAGTNTVVPKLVFAVAPSSTFVTPVGLNYYFYQGLWVSNSTGYGAGTNGNGSNAPAITVVYK